MKESVKYILGFSCALIAAFLCLLSTGDKGCSFLVGVLFMCFWYKDLKL